MTAPARRVLTLVAGMFAEAEAMNAEGDDSGYQSASGEPYVPPRTGLSDHALSGVIAMAGGEVAT